MAKIISELNVNKAEVNPQETNLFEEHYDQKQSQLDLISEYSQQAYKQGREDGFLAGQEDMQLVYKERFQTIEHLIQEIPRQILLERQKMVPYLTNLLIHTFIHYFNHAEHLQEILSEQVQSLLLQIHPNTSISLKLHPKDIRLLQEGKINLDFKKNHSVKIIPDESLLLGGCYVETEQGLWDGSLETQIQNLKQIILHWREKQHEF